MTDNQALTTKPAAGALQTLPSAAFWDQAKATSELITWTYREGPIQPRLKAHPSPSDVVQLGRGHLIADAASGRLKPGTAYVRKAQLAALLLHYPVRKFTDEQWNVWANAYHELLKDCPDELFVDACRHWLKTVPDRMPSPADLVGWVEVELRRRKWWVDNCAQAANALALWKEETRAKPEH